MRACECRFRPGGSVPRVARYDRPKGGYTLAYLATERNSTKPAGTPLCPHSILITTVSQSDTGRSDGSKDYPCHCRHRPSNQLHRQMPPQKPSLNGGRPAIPSVPLFPEDFGLSSCPCSTLPPMPFPRTETVLPSGIVACGNPCFLRRRQPPSPTGRRTGRSCLSPCRCHRSLSLHSHPTAFNVKRMRMERKSSGFLKAYCSLFPAVIFIIPYQFVNGMPDCGCCSSYSSCNGNFPCPFAAVPALRPFLS